MTPRRIQFAASAADQIAREQDWWTSNRDRTDLFATELEQALDLLALMPGLGTPYAPAGIAGLRPFYLEKIGCHIYYTFTESSVVVRAMWGAHRGRGPSLEP